MGVDGGVTSLIGIEGGNTINHSLLGLLTSLFGGADLGIGGRHRSSSDGR